MFLKNSMKPVSCYFFDETRSYFFGKLSNVFETCSIFVGIPPDIFSWKRYLQKSAGTATCPPLEAFSDRIPLPICWTRKLIGLYIEFSVRSNQRFWYYKVVDTKGYYILLETLGNESEQVWISLACPHYRGFSHLDKKMLASNIMNTPFDSNEKMRMKLLKQMHGKHTLRKVTSAPKFL